MCELKNLRESANRACELNEVKSAGKKCANLKTEDCELYKINS